MTITTIRMMQAHTIALELDIKLLNINNQESITLHERSNVVETNRNDNKDDNYKIKMYDDNNPI
jgi:hypothetical protein